MPQQQSFFVPEASQYDQRLFRFQPAYQLNPAAFGPNQYTQSFQAAKIYQHPMITGVESQAPAAIMLDQPKSPGFKVKPQLLVLDLYSLRNKMAIGPRASFFWVALTYHFLDMVITNIMAIKNITVIKNIMDMTTSGQADMSKISGQADTSKTSGQMDMSKTSGQVKMCPTYNT
ncbi:hypothetical protein QYM36_009901 [Artemia franciscana]|uniref:Uncharacterized protein n=1 Tax=Artemia franciscana TaxID=6661 RepID=A0AA88LB97_ARTSF|nr:hypothetical protein QYM36_009901 [Artemia franciscana]